VFFLDRCLQGEVVIEKLRASGFVLKLHRDHFAPDAEDAVFLPMVTEKK
jgi:hypothetical protein